MTKPSFHVSVTTSPWQCCPHVGGGAESFSQPSRPSRAASSHRFIVPPTRKSRAERRGRHGGILRLDPSTGLAAPCSLLLEFAVHHEPTAGRPGPGPRRALPHHRLRTGGPQLLRAEE